MVNKVQNGELINHLKGWFLLCLLYGKCQYLHLCNYLAPRFINHTLSPGLSLGVFSQGSLNTAPTPLLQSIRDLSDTILKGSRSLFFSSANLNNRPVINTHGTSHAVQILSLTYIFWSANIGQIHYDISHLFV